VGKAYPTKAHGAPCKVALCLHGRGTIRACRRLAWPVAGSQLVEPDTTSLVLSRECIETGGIEPGLEPVRRRATLPSAVNLADTTEPFCGD
jgi:hypothetical protein